MCEITFNWSTKSTSTLCLVTGLNFLKCNPTPSGGILSKFPLNSQFGDNAPNGLGTLLCLGSFCPGVTDTKPSLQRGYFSVTSFIEIQSKRRHFFSKTLMCYIDRVNAHRRTSLSTCRLLWQIRNAVLKVLKFYTRRCLSFRLL